MDIPKDAIAIQALKKSLVWTKADTMLSQYYKAQNEFQLDVFTRNTECSISKQL
jgi:hypothetical protein